MNRIQQFVEDTSDEEATTPALAVELAPNIEGTEQDAHCIVTPLHYERNYAYPLIVWLHGPEGDERQVTRVMPLVSSRNYAAVGPRGTVALDEVEGRYGWSQEAQHIAQAEQRVMTAVKAARTWLNIAPERIYLAGLGSGGTMAFRLALAHPHWFAGVLSFGGPFPTTLRPLARLEHARRLRFFIANGLESTQYPEAEMCRNLRLFHSAGMSLWLRLYPCGDELLSNMLSDMDRWIMEQFASRCDPQKEPSHRLPRR